MPSIHLAWLHWVFNFELTRTRWLLEVHLTGFHVTLLQSQFQLLGMWSSLYRIAAALSLKSVQYTAVACNWAEDSTFQYDNAKLYPHTLPSAPSYLVSSYVHCAFCEYAVWVWLSYPVGHLLLFNWGICIMDTNIKSGWLDLCLPAGSWFYVFSSPVFSHPFSACVSLCCHYVSCFIACTMHHLTVSALA